MRLTLVPTAKLSPLLQRRPDVDDYCVMRDGKKIGRIVQHHGGPRDGQWSWYVRRDFRVKGQVVTSTVDTLEHAKAAFKAAAYPTNMCCPQFCMELGKRRLDSTQSTGRTDRRLAVIMKIEEYRPKAKQCEQRAAEAKDPAVRELLRHIAN